MRKKKALACLIKVSTSLHQPRGGSHPAKPRCEYAADGGHCDQALRLDSAVLHHHLAYRKAPLKRPSTDSTVVAAPTSSCNETCLESAQFGLVALGRTDDEA